MGHTYLMTFPVSEKEEARTLGSSSAWDVVEELREVGLNGLTAEELSKKLDLPYSTVYNILSKLRAAGWVESRRSKKQLGRPNKARQGEMARTGRMRQIYVENIPWGSVEVEEEFEEILGNALKHIAEKDELVASFASALDRILTDLQSQERGKELFPSSNPCPKCHRSHEAEEFLYAIGFSLTSTLLDQKFAQKIKPVLEKHGVKGAFD